MDNYRKCSTDEQGEELKNVVSCALEQAMASVNPPPMNMTVLATTDLERIATGFVETWANVKKDCLVKARFDTIKGYGL